MSNSVSYRISHETRYRYSEPVAICQNQLRMTPRPFSRKFSAVECHWVETAIDPEPDVIDVHADYFGNQVVSFSIESLHRVLVVNVKSEVTVHQHELLPGGDSKPWEQIVSDIQSYGDARWFEVQEYMHDSPRIRRSGEFADYARKAFTPDRPILEAALELTRQIHDDFKYDVAATHVHSTTEEAFQLKAGVCQDCPSGPRRRRC